MRKIRIIGIITLLILIIIFAFLPFFLDSTANEALVVGSDIISALASLVTSLIAVLLYSKYGVERSVLDKQTESALQLLAELKKTSFLCEYDDGILQLRLDCLQDKYWEKYKDKKLLFDAGYTVGLKNIWDIADNVFLPVEIVKKINPLIAQSLVEDKNAADYMVVKIPGYYSEKEKENHFFGILNGKRISVNGFVGLWDSVIQATVRWLKLHSSTPVDFNFERN